MIYVPMNTAGAFDKNTLICQNRASTPFRSPAAAFCAEKPQPMPAAQVSAPFSPPKMQRIPPFLNPIQKGQKALIASGGSFGKVKACFGWNVKDPRCDVDVSAFLLGADGKVSGDAWFVFYGQKKSPDGSVEFSMENHTDRESIAIDLSRLNPNVKKIVFVLTINEAFEKKQHFEMVEDAYIRIVSQDARTESVSFKMTEYYANVTSMMIGELYQYNGAWKFSAVGNGVARDLAGLCRLYGVQIG